MAAALALVAALFFALAATLQPLGYFLTSQRVGRREILGAAAIVVGLSIFVLFGDPAGGSANASDAQWAITIGLLSFLCVVLLFFGSADLAVKTPDVSESRSDEDG